jgi:hypothetical protein
MTPAFAVREFPMEDRIRHISHKGKKILLVDLSHCSVAEVQKISRLVPAYANAEPLGSVLLLADFTDAKIDRKAADRIKMDAVLDRPHLKRSAWVGTEAIPHVFFENMKSFTQRELPSFKTREEALDWLVQD